jgi:hypothetical protein
MYCTRRIPNILHEVQIPQEECKYEFASGVHSGNFTNEWSEAREMCLGLLFVNKKVV